MKLLLRNNQIIGTATDDYDGPEAFAIAGDDYYAAEEAKKAADLQDELNRKAARTHTKLVALKNMSPAEVQAWCGANITNLASAKEIITTLCVAMCILSKKL